MPGFGFHVAPFVAVAAAVALALGGASCGGSEEADPAPVVTRDPAVTFAPLVHLHSKERWYPISAAEFIDYSTTSWAIDGCSDKTIAIGAPRLKLGRDGKSPIVDPHRLGVSNPYRYRTWTPQACRERPPTRYAANQLTRPYDERRDARPPGLPIGDGFYLDLLTERLKGKHDVRREDGQEVLADVPIYVVRSATRADGRPAVRLTYWLLYGINETPGKGKSIPLGHEGDWERVSVLLHRSGPDRFLPLSVTYFADGAREERPWSDVDRVSDTAVDETDASHPVVYAAHGNHSPYPSAGRKDVTVRQAGRRYAIQDEAESCTSCPQWRTWRNVLNARVQPWYGFGGSWGYVDYSAKVPGPLGPSRHNE